MSDKSASMPLAPFFVPSHRRKEVRNSAYKIVDGKPRCREVLSAHSPLPKNLHTHPASIGEDERGCGSLHNRLPCTVVLGRLIGKDLGEGGKSGTASERSHMP